MSHKIMGGGLHQLLFMFTRGKEKTPEMGQKMAEYLSGRQGVPGEPEDPDLRDKYRAQLHFPAVMRTRYGKDTKTKSKELISWDSTHMPPRPAHPQHRSDSPAGSCGPTGAWHMLVSISRGRAEG